MDAILESQIVAPSSVGDVISQSLRLCRNNFKFLVKTLLFPSLIELVGNLCIVIGANGITAGDSSHLLQNILILLPGLLFRLIGEFMLTLRQLALIRWFTGFASSYKEASDFIWKRKFYVVFAVVAIYTLTMAALFFWAVVMGVSLVFIKYKAVAIFAITAVCVSFIAMFVSLILCALPLSLITPAIACESSNFTTVMTDSITMTFKNFFRTFLFTILLMLTVYVVDVALDSVPIVATFFERFRAIMFSEGHSLPKTVNLYVQVLSSVWHAVSNMLVSPVYICFLWIILCRFAHQARWSGSNEGDFCSSSGYYKHHA